MELTSAENVRSFCNDHLQNDRVDSVERLSKGLMNYVWRVELKNTDSRVVKYAPPYIATAEEVPLPTSRLDFERKAIEEVTERFNLDTLRLSLPGLHQWHPEESVLIESFIEDAQSLETYFRRQDEPLEKLGRILGRFIGRLHAETRYDSALSKSMNNAPIQKMRHQIQYQSVADWLETNIDDTGEQLATNIRSLGERFQEPGNCLIMGDLWPQSVLINDEGPWLIDWEFSHFGHPAQDIGHLAAHVWMWTHAADWKEWEPQPIQTFWQDWCQAYFSASSFSCDEVIALSARHFAAEVLVRTAGPFKAGYLYEGLEPDRPEVRKTVELIVETLRDPTDFGLLET